LTGVVTDQSNAVIPNAEVEIKDNSKGAIQLTKTDREGVYRFFFLAPCVYTLTVWHDGFRKNMNALNSRSAVYDEAAKRVDSPLGFPNERAAQVPLLLPSTLRCYCTWLKRCGRGKLSIPLGRRFALKDASKAHAAVERGATGKILLIA
jgi:hypothetical protein